MGEYIFCFNIIKIKQARLDFFGHVYNALPLVTDTFPSQVQI